MKKMKTQSIMLLVILLAGLICLTGMAAADETYSISYDDANPGENKSHGTPTLISLSNDDVITISTAGPHILQPGTFSNITITITAPDVILVLNNTSITNPTTNNIDTSPLRLIGSNVTLVLMDGSNNSFVCNGTNGGDFNMQAGIFMDLASNLTIRGQNDNTGKLTAIGGAYSAGIGGGPNGNPGKITIEGGNITAESNSNITESHRNGAGIGNGGGNIHPANTSTEEIIIRGKANVTAISKGNGAGIGGGGSIANIAGTSGPVKIYGDATVTATSEGRGAGIGGGGTAGNHATNSTAGGSGGIIEIYGNANVTATSLMYGAGIGGGGSNNSTAGAGGTITIKDNANVTATSRQHGAGIGGGGYYTNNGGAGAGGTVTIDGTPIIVVNGLYMDIGPGSSSTNTNQGTAGQITIDSGNVYAINTTSVENYNSDPLGMITVSTGIPNTLLTYDAIDGSNTPYTYEAITNGNGDAFIWIPLGNQLVIYEDTMNAILEVSMEALATGSNEIEPRAIVGYATPINQTVVWDGASPLNPITFTYSDEAILTLKAVNLATLNEIEMSGGIAITYDKTTALNSYYDYSGDIAALTAAVNLEHPGRYALWAHGSTIVNIDSTTKTVEVYYTLVPGTSTGGGGSGHGSATVVDNNNATGNTTNGSNNTTPTRLTILCVDENGNELFVQSLTTVVGSSEAINAPPLKGYELLTNQASQNVRMETGENTITFRYTPTNDQQPSGENRQNSRWSLPWYIFVPIFIIGIAASFLIGQKIRKNE
jgi:Formylmethanofuran dehydrogenase subunit C